MFTVDSFVGQRADALIAVLEIDANSTVETLKIPSQYLPLFLYSTWAYRFGETFVDIDLAMPSRISWFAETIER
jgi:hypothetical protein